MKTTINENQCRFTSLFHIHFETINVIIKMLIPDRINTQSGFSSVTLSINTVDENHKCMKPACLMLLKRLYIETGVKQYTY